MSRDKHAVWTQSMRIALALNSHWPIRLRNQFESSFCVDRPLVHVWSYTIAGLERCNHGMTFQKFNIIIYNYFKILYMLAQSLVYLHV